MRPLLLLLALLGAGCSRVEPPDSAPMRAMTVPTITLPDEPDAGAPAPPGEVVTCADPGLPTERYVPSDHDEYPPDGGSEHVRLGNFNHFASTWGEGGLGREFDTVLSATAVAGVQSWHLVITKGVWADVALDLPGHRPETVRLVQAPGGALVAAISIGGLEVHRLSSRLALERSRNFGTACAVAVDISDGRYVVDIVRPAAGGGSCQDAPAWEFHVALLDRDTLEERAAVDLPGVQLRTEDHADLIRFHGDRVYALTGPYESPHVVGLDAANLAKRSDFAPPTLKGKDGTLGGLRVTTRGLVYARSAAIDYRIGDDGCPTEKDRFVVTHRGPCGCGDTHIEHVAER